MHCSVIVNQKFSQNGAQFAQFCGKTVFHLSEEWKSGRKSGTNKLQIISLSIRKAGEQFKYKHNGYTQIQVSMEKKVNIWHKQALTHLWTHLQETTPSTIGNSPLQ